MSQITRHGKTSFRNAFIAFSAFLTAFYWLVVASYPQFFIFNPFDETWLIRQVALILSLIGWVAISTVPSVVLFMYAAGNSRGLKLLPIVATLWPFSVVVNQILLYIRDQTWYFDYLINYPIFIATDILLPVLLFVLWRELHEYHAKHEG
ncbi:MAG: hypothetical protein RI929_358 [Actinomycetota bacterium]|jgi:hypothetical protein